MSPWVTTAVVQAYVRGTPLPRDPLTSREREVVQRIAEGQTTKEIAAGLELSVKTVESHRSTSCGSWTSMRPPPSSVMRSAEG